jgi:hypothetical protein
VKIWDFIKQVSKTVKELSDSRADLGTSIELHQETFQKIIQVIEHRAVVSGVVPRLSDPAHLDVVGEANYQEDLAELAKNKPGSEAGWFSGFLLPEPTNEYDPNAVAVYMIDKTGPELMVCKVGYLPRALAKEVSGVILEKIASEGEVVPILAGLNGGEMPDRPAYGVNAQCFWDFKTTY